MTVNSSRISQSNNIMLMTDKKFVSPHLLSPVNLHGLVLRNRVVMAPLTRARAGRERVPNDLMAI